ncbi:twin-arginine translocase TatA/TatE family subunit [Amycolatopsis sp. NPDC059027]|uniref:twin-arginine translocase TatA/TatE family subunit n=1 Tax=Amycolatopsis sp. NPDC059027 TaxID=3346709 RepID=UPI00367342F8
MFGLSIEHILVLVVAGLFILGPERLPGALQWLGQSIRKVRAYASGAQEQLKSELGPEFDQLRKPLQDLQSLREFNPKTVVTSYLLDEPAPAAAQPVANGTPVAPPPTPLRPGERPPVDPDAT